MPFEITDFIEKERNKGTLHKKDLKEIKNLKRVFQKINNHLYAKLKNIDTDTRTRSKEIVNLLLCKLIDEINKDSEDIVDFQIMEAEKPINVFNRVKKLFELEVKQKYSSVIKENETIGLNAKLVYLIVEKLQGISILKSSKDIFKDAFEVFVSKILKDENGQFFTPSNVVDFMVKYLNPEITSTILDPACGHGGFLLKSMEFLLQKSKKKGDFLEDRKEIHKIIASNLYGIDKDFFLAKICKLYLDILSDASSNVFCEDSLDQENYDPKVKVAIKNNGFDVILTNPPFGAKIPIDDKEILRNYQLAYKWKEKDAKWKRGNKLRKKQPPQILFIERCVQLLKDGGKLGIILPEGLFGNPSDRYIWDFLKKKGRILGVISLDQNAFQPFTCNKTSILFFQKLKIIPDGYFIDFSIVENVGHNKDGDILYKLNNDGSIKKEIGGNPIINDDLENLEKRTLECEVFDYTKNQTTFKININDIKKNIFIPSYYLGVEKPLKRLESNKQFILKSIKELVAEKIIYTNNLGYIPRGDEIGSSVYGLGEIPFIRTSEIANWEINLDSNKKTSEEIYHQYKENQNIEEGDILLVKDGGPNLIGKTAYITELDTKIIIQSHIYQLKLLKNSQAIDSYLLLFLLNLDIVQKQIQAITFVQGTIATIGSRIMEIKLPIPANLEKRKEISNYIKHIIEEKTNNRKKIIGLSLNTFFS
ncbi:MAG: putative type I restriction enzymeP M protein [Promethearchaeota archaeon]|nr:MAG: putative type I restriction enzymeP M protein [Candidatus Lokiarchaeota archaeon]